MLIEVLQLEQIISPMDVSLDTIKAGMSNKLFIKTFGINLSSKRYELECLQCYVNNLSTRPALPYDTVYCMYSYGTTTVTLISALNSVSWPKHKSF